MSRRLLITGGNGFLGREVVRVCKGFEIHLVDRSGAAPADCIGHSFDLLADDPVPLLNRIAPSHLLHLAWHVPPGNFWSAPENLDWVAASLRLTRAFAASGGRRAVFAGSCAEYDWSHEILDELATPLRPHTLYGEAKASLFRIVMAAAPTLDLSIAWGRLFFPYGPFEKAGRLFSSVVDSLSVGEPVSCSEGSQIRDFLHVDDCARAFAALIDSGMEGAVNIASGQGKSVREFTTITAESVGAPGLVRFGERPMQNGEPSVMTANVRRLREELGFRSTFDLRSGIGDAVRRRLERDAP